MPIISQSNSYYWTSMPPVSHSRSCNWTSMPPLSHSPNSVHTVGVLAVTLGLAVWCAGNPDVYVDAQARYLVHVASLPCRREARSRHFLQKNNVVSAHFPSQSRWSSWWLQGDPWWVQRGLWMSLQGCLEVAPESFWVPSSWSILDSSP